MISKLLFLAHITLRNLGTKDAGADETEYGDSREDDNILVASPAEWVLLAHEVQKTIEGNTTCYEEYGDKHRRKKCINHNTAIRGNEITSTRGVLSERRCKGRGILTDSPAKFAEGAINLFFVD